MVDPVSSLPPLPPASDPARWDRLSWRLLLAGALVRLLYAALYPMNLAGDEAYYWEWSRHLDWGYFSKPPGIAWLMAAVTAIGGDHTVTIRLAAALIGTGSLLLFRQLARDLFDARAGFIAVLLALATPANVLLNLMLTIDAPLVFCWSAALWCLWSWLQGRRPALALTGLVLALGFGYLSKQMMLVFPLLAILYLATSARHREKLRSPGFWIAVLVSVAFLIPPVLWNARHDWITFQHTGGQLAGDTDHRAFGVTFLEFLVTQAGVLSPLIWFFTMAGACLGLLRYRALGEAERFLVVFSAPALVVMTLMALRQTMLPNWAAVYYVAAMLLVAGWLAGLAPALRLPERWRGWLRPALALGFAIVAIGYLWPPVVVALGHSGHEKLDPMRRLRGHADAAAAAEAFLARAPDPAKTLIITHGHRYHASHLAFYLTGQPRVYRWESRDQIASQYELWPDPVEDGKAGWDAIIFVPDREKKVPNRFQGAFDAFEPLGELVVPISPDYERYYRVYLGRHLKAWPKGMLPEDAPAAAAAPTDS
jgi:hypothetical protein